MPVSRARAFLDRLRVMAHRLDVMAAQCRALHEMATNANAQISDMPRSDSPNLHRLEDLMCRIADLDTDIANGKIEMENIRLEIALMICRLGDPVIERVLTLRYIDCKKWSDIMNELGYSRSRVFGLHCDGICAVEKMMMEDDKK